ncbi:putative small oligopeptide opt family protein [Diplocarpon rosae]|nr:putative small oligopeptide opt family protein [Diplocarpon rosae]
MAKRRLHRTLSHEATADDTIDGISSSPPQFDSISSKDAKDTRAEIGITATQASHQWDPNLPQSTDDALNSAIKSNDIERLQELEALVTEDSPYEEVRAAVRTTDGGEVANTVRAWVLGMIFVTLGSGLNMFLSMRFVLLDYSMITYTNTSEGVQP